ncbi:MAG: RIP metalloprotease RseP [Caldilineaceae bacterium]|nr:RIP metalloprotease RseP [Caldilineaceae bacterium]
MDLLITLVSFILVLGVLVFFHELGHYWLARRNGIVVEEFGMGYPPRLIKLFTYDGTVFSINLIPFGGFARMKGEDGNDLTPGSFNAASRWGRASTLIAGPLMNVLLAIIFFAASFMAGFPAPVAHPQVTAVAPDSPAMQVGLQPGDVLLEADGRPTLVSADPGDRYAVWKPAAGTAATVLKISRNDEMIELNVASQQLVSQVLDSLQYAPVLDTEISNIADGSPAQQQGLQNDDIVYKVGDTVVAFDGIPLNDVVAQNVGRSVPITVLRDGQWVTVNVTPRIEPPAGQGALGVQIRATANLATLPFLAALWEGVVSTFGYIMVVLQLPFLLLSGYLSPADAQLSGPVAIANMVGSAAQATIDTGLWFPIWRLSAILSAALAVTNLLPLPALDGGRLLFILIETLRGRRINPEREGLVHMVGFMLLLGLMVYITVQDIRTGGASIDWHALLGQ